MTFTRDDIKDTRLARVTPGRSAHGEYVEKFDEVEAAAEDEAAADEIAADETAADAVDEVVEEEIEAATERVPEVEPLRFPDQLMDEPMPVMSDPDVAFDNGRWRAKMAHWVKTQGRIEARRTLREEEDRLRGQKVHQSIEAKVARFEAEHPDFKEKVRENKLLAQNQLHPIAGRLVQKSEYTADVLYSFGSDVAHAVRVAKMDPEDQILAINDMIAKIKAEKKAKSASQRGDGPQRQPVRTVPLTRDHELSGKDSMSEFARQSRERMQKRSPRYYK
jgi:hypothetical protein